MTEGKVTGANVSVKLDDAFMQAAVEGKPYVQQYPIDAANPAFTKEIDASTLWKKIVHNAWKSAEPGVLFWDTIIRESVPDCYADLGYKTVSTNPCGEIPLCPYDSCRLLAINLYSYVVNPFKPDAYFDFDLFKKHVALAQRIMDDIIDLELEKIERIMKKIDEDPENEEVKRAERVLWEKIYKKSGQGRRTGVGITAEGDMLAALGLRYGTEEATEFSEKVHKTVALGAYRSSVEMAKERGAFEIYNNEREQNNPFIKRLAEADPELYAEMKKYGRRNIACLTIAPTGTTSLMTQTTSGIEPVFLPVYKRRRKVNPNDTNVHVDFVDETGDAFEEYIVFHHKFVTWMEANGYDPSKRYSQEEIDELVAKSPYYKATSNDVDWLMKVKMQGRIQKWVDHSISVTINLPNDVDEDLVNRLYVEAWKSGCKGCTVYRDGSRSGVLISTKSEKKGDLPPCKPPTVVEVRPRILEADVVRFQNNKEKWVAFVGLLDGHPYEIFTGLQDDDEGILLPKSVTCGRIIKNVDEDGTKRYDFQFEKYADAKMRIIQNQTKEDSFIYWNDDPVIKKELEKFDVKAVQYPFSELKEKGSIGYIEEGQYILETPTPFNMEQEDLSLTGKHNIYNSLAAGLASNISGITKENIRKSLSNFPGVEHRLEKVCKVAGVQYINDSKATNVDACWYALESMRTPTILIIGGKDKGNDYTPIKELVKEKCVGLVYLGADNKKLHENFDELGIPVRDTHSMKECMDACYEMAKSGDTVLLSPCCASFDLFKNMEDRGEQFKTLARAL